MSHIVTIQARVHDPAAVAAACRRLNLPEPVQGTTTLFSGEAAGLVVRLPGWLYPAVVDTTVGQVAFDNFLLITDFGESARRPGSGRLY